MGRVESGQGSEGIKLFGTTIKLYGRDRKEDKKQNCEDGTEEIKRPDKIIACPRCKSMETKFCYFNNYNVNQPRHFCKGCQRYWTAGGALRNVPVGAGRRKAKPPCLDSDGRQQLAFEEIMVLDEWRLSSMPHAHFRHLFQSKRTRISSGGQRQPS